MSPAEKNASETADSMGTFGKALANGNAGDIWDSLKFPLLGLAAIVGFAVMTSPSDKE